MYKWTEDVSTLRQCVIPEEDKEIAKQPTREQKAHTKEIEH